MNSCIWTYCVRQYTHFKLDSFWNYVFLKYCTNFLYLLNPLRFRNTSKKRIESFKEMNPASLIIQDSYSGKYHTYFLLHFVVSDYVCIWNNQINTVFIVKMLSLRQHIRKDINSPGKWYCNREKKEKDIYFAKSSTDGTKIQYSLIRFSIILCVSQMSSKGLIA